MTLIEYLGIIFVLTMWALIYTMIIIDLITDTFDEDLDDEEL